MAKQAKKTRRATKTQPEKRKPGRPASIPEATLKAVHELWVAGVHPNEICENYGISLSSIYGIARKRNWLTPREIRKQIAKEQEDAGPEAKDVMSNAIRKTYLSDQKAYVSVVEELTDRIMREISARPPDVQNWRDVEIVDKMGRRARGLDVADTKQNVLVNVGSLMSDPDAEL